MNSISPRDADHPVSRRSVASHPSKGGELATLKSFSLPFLAQNILRGKEKNTREGLIIILRKDEKIGYGEASPLPGFNAETLSEAKKDLIQLCEAWLAGEKINNENASPSASFGFSCALAELNRALPEAFASRSAQLDSTANAHSQKNNSLISLEKIKLDFFDPKSEALQISQRLKDSPNSTLRLDANRRWTLDEAKTFADALDAKSKSRIEFIEEPCDKPQHSLAFSATSKIKIAWDETTRDIDFVIQKDERVAAVIVKPTMLGSLEKCVELIDQARAYGMQAIISSSFESSLALSQLSRLAAWKTPDSLPGLDTLWTMDRQIIRRFPNCELPLVSEDELETVWEKQGE
jgi:O-succinylbenzoate synthase